MLRVNLQELDGRAASLAQARIVGGPIRDLKALFRNRVAGISDILEW